MAGEVTKILSTETSSWDARNERAHLRNAAWERLGRGDGCSLHLMILHVHRKVRGHFIQTSEGEVALILDQLLASKARNNVEVIIFMAYLGHKSVGSAGKCAYL